MSCGFEMRKRFLEIRENKAMADFIDRVHFQMVGWKRSEIKATIKRILRDRNCTLAQITIEEVMYELDFGDHTLSR